MCELFSYSVLLSYKKNEQQFQNDDFLRGASEIKKILYFIFRPLATFQKFDFTTSL